MALGRSKKKKSPRSGVPLKLNMNAPFAFALGANFKTNKARLLQIDENGLIFELPQNQPIPHLEVYFNLPFVCRLPGDNQTTWNFNIDVDRIYALDPKENPVYGMKAEFINMTREKEEQLQTYLQNMQNAMAQRRQQAQQQQQAQR